LAFHRPLGYLIESENQFLQCLKLDKSFCNKTSFVFFNGAIYPSFDTKTLLQPIGLMFSASGTSSQVDTIVCICFVFNLMIWEAIIFDGWPRR
jgi:hypothetical protein